jgi:hypothetical protein
MKKYITKQSSIKGAGKGLFTKESFKKGEVIGLAHVDDQPASEIGRNHNHNEKNPTAYSKKIDNKRYIYASKDLKPGEEITTNYRLQPELEQPEDFMRKGGSVLRLPNKKNSKRYSRSLSATNKLFTQNFLFEKPKSRKNKVFDPHAKYYAEGGTYEEAELTPEEIEAYRAEGYTVDDNEYQDGGQSGKPCPEEGYAFNPKTGECIEWNPAIWKSNDEPTSYNPVADVIYMNPNDRPEGMSDKEYQQMYQDQLEHEQLHRFQWINGELKGYSGTPLRMPSPVDNEEHDGEHYYNRRSEEVDYLQNYWKKDHPAEAEFMPDSLIYDKETNPVMYELPWTVEGEAREYEYNTRDGMPSLFPKKQYGGLHKIDWNGIQIPYRLPRFRKPGSYGDLIKPGKKRYINLPKITSRNTAYLREKQDGGDNQSNGETYKYLGRPDSLYKKSLNGRWSISNKSTGNKFVSIEDPKGSRTTELDKNAVTVSSLNKKRRDHLSKLHKEIAFPKEFVDLNDTRTVRATTGEKINPNVDLKGDKYNKAIIDNIIKKSKAVGVDPSTMLAIALQETNFGKTDPNLGHVKKGYKGYPYSYIDFYKQKLNEAKFKDELLQIQYYNGLGTVYPETEEDYHGYEMQKIYGVPLPASGINMRKNPLYGKQIIDLRDNVILKNPYIQKALKQKQKGGDNTDAMTGMMKARLAYANEFGNPAAERMINLPDNPYQFDNGDTGSHYMASYDNYAVPQIQDENGVLQLGDYGPESNEAIRFDSDEDANYFAKNYKDVSPGFIEAELDEDEIEEYRRGGYIVEEIDNYQDGGVYTVKGSKGAYKKVNGKWQVDWNRSGKYQPLSKGDVKARTAVLDKMAKPVDNGISKISSNSSDNTRVNNIYQKPLDWSFDPKYKNNIQAFVKKSSEEKEKAIQKEKEDNKIMKGLANNENIKETVGQFNKRQNDWEHSNILNRLFTDAPESNYIPEAVGRSPFEDSQMTGIGGAPKIILQAGKWLKPLWTGTKTVVKKTPQGIKYIKNSTQPFRKATVSSFKTPLPLGKKITDATGGKLNLGNSVAAYFGADALYNQGDSNSDVVKSQSNFINNPSWNTLGDAAFETGVNSLGFSGLGLGKQVFKPTYNASKKLIKGFKRVPKQLPGSPNAVSSADDVVKAGFDGNFLTRPLTLFTKNELTQGNQLYRKIGNTKGLQDLINKGGAQAPAPMRMNSGQMLDTPFFGIGNKPNENYGGLFAVETALPSKSKYDWSSRVGGTNNYGLAPIDPTTGRTIQNIPLEDLEVFRKKWFSNSYRKLDKQNLQKELKSANLQELSEKLYKWGIRGYIADQILNDGDLTGGKAVKIIEKYFEDGAKQYEKGGIVADLAPEEIQRYIDGGYVVKEIDNYQDGGVNKKGKSYDYTRDPTYTERFKRFFGMEDVDDIAYEKVDDKNIKKYKQTTKPIEKTIRKIPTIETKSNFELDLKNRLQNIAKENILKEKNISKVEPIKNSLQITKNNNSNIKNKIVKPEDSFFESTYKEIKSFNNWLDNQKKVFDNGIERKFQTWGIVETKDKKVIESPEPLNVKDYYKNPTLSQTILNVNDQPNRQFKQQTVPTSNLVLGSRNRGQYQDIETDGLEFTTFHPFNKAANIKPYNKKTNVNGINDNNSVFALDNKGVLHTGIYKNLKNNKDWKFSRTFMNKIVSIDDISLDGSRSGNHKFWQPQITILENNKLKKGALNILTKKGKAEEDYYGSILGGRVVFVNPLTKEQTLVSGSVSHIKKEFKRLKGDSKYLEAWSLDNGTYARGLSYKDGNLTKQRLINYDAENTSGGNGLYIKKYNVPVNKFKETYVYDMPNVRTKKDASYKAGHKLKNEIKNFVLHHTAYNNPITNEAEVKKQFMTPGQNSSHVVIEEDGSRTIYASPEQVSFHAGKSKWNGREDVNDFSIGVEFQGDTQKKPLTDQQVISFVEYYAPIAKKYNLNLKSIITHEQIRNAYIKKHANEKGLETKPDITYNQYKRILNYMKAKGIN